MIPTHSAPCSRRVIALSAVWLCLALSGCATQPDTAIFITKTSFSLLDLDSTPAGVSIAYDRVEGYVGPRFDDGTVFPVASVLETNGDVLDRQIKQVFATGTAARLITSKEPLCDCPTPASDPEKDGNKVVLFGTGTVLGVKIGMAEGAPSLTLGYKRREAALIPVDKTRQPSVLASFDNTTGAGSPTAAVATPAAAASGPVFRVEQFFATGLAAENLARLDKIRMPFQDKAERAIGEVQLYRNEEARQGRYALDTLACFTRLDDTKLDRVWSNAEALGVLSPNSVERIRLAPDVKHKRESYTGSLRLLNAGSPPYTALLGLHQTAVCELAKPGT